MRRFPLTLGKCKFELTFALSAILLTAGGLISQFCLAQLPSAAGPAPQAVFQDPIPAGQFMFLSDYCGKTAQEIKKDRRFRTLMKLVVPRTEYHYGHDMPLAETLESLLDGDPMPMTIRDGRYAMVASRGGPMFGGYGFMWFDMKDGIALGGVYFHGANGEPTPALAIFSRQLRDTSLSMSQLPVAFQRDLAQWVLMAGPRLVSTRYFIPENGKKYALLHDEDYCAYQLNSPSPPRDQCEDLDAEAADADVNAAYFMVQAHHAANATLWMLGDDQLAWIKMRDRSCGLGPVGVSCRIQLTRQRTQVLVGTGLGIGLGATLHGQERAGAY